MKLFGGNFKELFEYLEEKSIIDNMAGIDFRCMFLNPEAEEVKFAHKQQDIFLQELDATIKTNIRLVIIESSKNVFANISNRREEIIIRLDNCIIYSKPHFDENGQPQIMTDSKFEVFSATSERGKECIEKYCTVWNGAVDLF